ncbi:MAG: hypothetical protein HDQ91_03530 [Desulfovibrio sp.]|nr:hypothetical protein [Desulfovibrio sp.]
MIRILILALALAALLFPLTAAAEGNVPEAAACIGKQLDAQMMKRFGYSSTDTIGSNQNNEFARSRIMIMGTTPANLGNLQLASGLARQMTEEISRWLKNRGYKYEDLRKGRDIRFEQGAGEFLLTRRVPNLQTTSGVGQAILAGTYVRSTDDVRFNIELICVSTNEVLAKAAVTIPITPDLYPLLAETGSAGGGLRPSVYTRLR